MPTIAITGAARGIGFELARQHLAAGDRVFALARDPATATALNDLAAGSGGKLTVHAMDVADAASVKAGAADTGSEAIDILYNVAGISGHRAPELESLDEDTWDALFEVMVKGPLRVLQAFLPRLESGAKVINLSSQIGASTWPYGGFYAYASSKAALNRLMRSVATDLKPRGVVVGLVHPGYVQTDMGGAQAEITPQESAEGLRSLAAGWTIEQTGAFFDWNGKRREW
ncbi:SDR family oxidoreductase [Novosphingobium sp.]|uniref:SDR family oxidoreductase n=1 Tax=Novosphingobium sp. TaxID=1874826 RepID=UPI0025E723D2|nr:SDR family oxidoreductase [Novosphingobium sp.]